MRFLSCVTILNLLNYNLIYVSPCHSNSITIRNILHDVASNSNPWIKNVPILKSCWKDIYSLLNDITTQTTAFIPFMSFYIHLTSTHKQYNKPHDLRLQQCQNIQLMYLPSLPALAVQCLKSPSVVRVPSATLLWNYCYQVHIHFSYRMKGGEMEW